MSRLNRLLGLGANYRLFARAPIIAKHFLRLNAELYLRRRTPVIVFSMERTGTVALFQSLANHGVFALATHYLDPAKASAGYRAGSARWAARHIIRPGRPARIISLARNPIENMLSVFARRTFGLDAEVLGRAAGTNSSGADSAQEVFAREFLAGRGYEAQLGWFDDEFRAALGVDVYRHPFDPIVGHARFREGPYDILLLRTELDDSSKAGAIRDFLGLETFEMTRPDGIRKRDGVDHGKPGENATYAAAYRELRERLVIPEEHWLAITESRYARHFCSLAELEDARAKYAAPVDVRTTHSVQVA